MSKLAGSRFRAIVILALSAAPAAGQGEPSAANVELREQLNETRVWAQKELSKPLDDRGAARRQDRVRIDGADIDAQGVTHLLTLMNKAQVKSESAAGAVEQPAALTIRDRSLSKPGANASVTPLKIPGLGRYVGLRFRQLTVKAEEIAEIHLTADFGDADRFVMSWSKAGVVQWPLEAAANDGVTTYRINTARLADWHGKLEYLVIGVPKGKPLEIRELRLLKRAAAFPKPAGTRKVMLQKRLSEAIYLHDRTSVTLPLSAIPVASRLAGATALIGAKQGQLKISLGPTGGEKVVLQRAFDHADTWQDFDLELDGGAAIGPLKIEVTGVSNGVVVIGAPVIYKPVAKPRRVLLYLIDTLAATHMSLYGYDRETTPRLDGLAARGAWFANAFANASRTVESVPSMMLSLPAVSSGMRHVFAEVDAEASLLAEDFRAAGYATACFSTNVNAGPRQGIDRGFDDFFDHIAFQWMENEARTVPIDAVVAWMENHRNRPTFVYIHTAEPHYPYEAPEPFRNRYVKDETRQATPAVNSTQRGGPIEKAQYDEEIAFADHRFHAFQKRLKKAGLTAGMVTMVTADHGEEFREHGGARHGTNLYGETLRVPLLIHGPADLVPARGRIDAAVELQDVRPTLLDLAGVKTAASMMGRSLRPLLRGEATPEWRERALFASTFQPDPPHYSLTKLPWRLIFAPRSGKPGNFELYDVGADPRESVNLIDEQQQVAIEMIRQLVETWRDLPRVKRQNAVKLDEAHLERLRALGYLDD